MLFSVLEYFVAEINQCKVLRGHKSAELIPNFPILARLKLTQIKTQLNFSSNYAVTYLSCSSRALLRSISLCMRFLS